MLRIGASPQETRKVLFAVGLNEAKSLVNVPFMALNATATKATKDKIFELLEFNCPVEGVENPNKNNIKYTEQLLDKNLPLVANFRSVIE